MYNFEHSKEDLIRQACNIKHVERKEIYKRFAIKCDRII